MSIHSQAVTTELQVTWNEFRYRLMYHAPKGWTIIRAPISRPWIPPVMERLTMEGWHTVMGNDHPETNYHDTAVDALDAIEQLG